MRVIFDLFFAQPIGDTKFHGGGEYIKSVFVKLAMEYTDKCQLEVCYNTSNFLDDNILNLIHSKKIKVHDVKSVADIVDILNEKTCGCFFTGMINGYGEYDLPNNIKKIGVCHGLRGIEKPYDKEAWRYIKNKSDIKEFVLNTFLKKSTNKKLVRWFENLLNKFDVIITDSEHSKYSIMNNLNIGDQIKNLKVFYTPAKEIERSNDVSNHKEKPYILIISSNRWIKNSYRAVIALDGLYDKHHMSNMKVRVYGGLPLKIRKKIRNIEMFEFYDYVSTEELENAYRGCELFLYPTLNEGFGLPPLEAMKYGKTCIISAVSSLPEIYGEAVYYCNPYDIKEIQNRVLYAYENKKTEKVISEKINSIKKRQDLDLIALCDMLIQ